MSGPLVHVLVGDHARLTLHNERHPDGITAGALLKHLYEKKETQQLGGLYDDKGKVPDDQHLEGLYYYYAQQGDMQPLLDEEAWAELCTGKVLAATDHIRMDELPEKLTAAGICSPKAVCAMNLQMLMIRLGLDTTDEDDVNLAQELKHLCAAFFVMFDRKEVLEMIPSRLVVSTVPAGDKQANNIDYGQPVSVEVWHGLEEEVRAFIEAMPATHKLFCCVSKMKTKKATALIQSVLDTLNVLLRYKCLKEDKLEEYDSYQWQQQARQTPTSSQEAYLSHPGHDREVAARRKDNSALDHAMRKSLNLLTLMVYEIKERLEGAAEFSKEQLVSIYASKLRVGSALQENVQGAVQQVNFYGGLHGLRYAAFGNYESTWFVHFKGPNQLQIAGPFSYDCSEPTLLQIMYALSCWAIEEGQQDRWTPIGLPEINSKPSSRNSSRPSSGRSSRRGSKTDEADGEDAVKRHGTKPSAPGSKRPSAGGSSKHAKKRPAAADTAEDSQDEADSDDQDQLPSEDIQHADLQSLARAASQIYTTGVLAIIGRGVTGEVFSYRLNGTLVALKFARKGTDAAAALEHEAAMYLALQPLWGQYMPKLVAAGHDLEDWAYVLATEYLEGQHLQPSADEHLQQQLRHALLAVHGLGVLHNDLRLPNVIVTAQGNKQQPWLIDFGHARTGASQQELDDEMSGLERLWGGA